MKLQNDIFLLHYRHSIQNIGTISRMTAFPLSDKSTNGFGLISTCWKTVLHFGTRPILPPIHPPAFPLSIVPTIAEGLREKTDCQIYDLGKL
jgi:hypothetical protein